MAKAKGRGSATGDETKARILEATLSTLKAEGIVGTSARAIARTGDFNQALIFYHFGSVNDAVIEAVARMGVRRMERHRTQLEKAETLTELIGIARSLHADDSENDNMTVLTQAFAGAAGDDDLGPRLYAHLEPWSDLVAETIARVTAASPMSDIVPHDQIARIISALFLGIELLDDLDPDRAGADALFDTLESLSGLLEMLLNSPLLSALSEQPSK
ncbi:MAG: TetR/AcrR family transcriptional regulator [Acidimicrobiales bacterium]